MSGISEIVEHLRNIIPYTFLVIFPLMILISPIDPIKAAQDFKVYRMQHYDYQGVRIGSRSAIFNFEAQTLGSKLLTRKCLILKLLETTSAVIRQAINQNVGGILIILPNKDGWTSAMKEHMVALEQELVSDEYQVAVLFAEEDETVLQVYDSVKNLVQAEEASSAASALMNALWSTGYQLYIPTGASKPLPDHEIVNIHGKLAGSGLEENLPTVLLVAHYDAFGIAPSLAYGADSSGSAVVALLTLARIFSRLYSMSRTHPKYNLVFLLAGGGKFNYIGTKKWLEEHAEIGDGSNFLSEVSLAMCLEGLSSGDDLYMHVSKPPKEGSPGHLLYTQLQTAVTQDTRTNKKVELVHKKINLNDDLLSWEHERYSIRKLPGLTISTYPLPSEDRRRSILDTHIDSTKLASNVRLVGEALMRFLYNVTDISPSAKLLPQEWVSPESLSPLVDLVTRFPRSAQSLPKGHRWLSTVEKQLRQYLQDVKVTGVKADKRDPEFLFYDGLTFTMSSHKVKPAVFELILACFIVLYLGALYLIVDNFQMITKFYKPAAPYSNGYSSKKSSKTQ